jgi:hypothetical protein
MVRRGDKGIGRKVLACAEAFHPEAGNPALKGGVFSKNGWGGVRIPSPTNQSRALRPGFQELIFLTMGFGEANDLGISDMSYIARNDSILESNM